VVEEEVSYHQVVEEEVVEVVALLLPSLLLVEVEEGVAILTMTEP
jgi:hypothetical protein